MKKLIALILIITLLTSVISFADTYEVQYKDYADKLKEIGVFKGTITGFELDREPTRIEAAIMFVRLLGAEKEALDKKYKHPFTDVPSWASDYVGYLYHKNLTNGVTTTTFGSTNNIKATSYFTFILRALGYDDKSGDFVWDQSLEFSINNSLISQNDFNELKENAFLRDNVAKISYFALNMPLKDKKTKLIEKLIDLNVIDRITANKIGLVEEINEISLSDNTIIDIEDTSLRNKVIETLNLKSNQDITFGDMKKLTSLANDTWIEISSLKGLEYAINLESLHLNKLTCDNENLFYIQNLTKLKDLEILIFYESPYLGEVSDISFLKNLINLEKLSLNFSTTGGKTIDASVLKNNQNLKELSFTFCNIKDISSLDNLNNLEKIYIDYTQIVDYTVFNSFKKLKSLYLEEGMYTHGRKLELSDLPDLEKIILGDNTPIKSLKLSNLPNLETVISVFGKISEISFSDVNKLERIELFSHEIEDISSIANVTNLKELSIPGNKIKDISSLKNLENLMYLNIAGNPLGDGAMDILKSIRNHASIIVDEEFDITNLEILSDDEPTTKLTSEIIDRLKSYPYYRREPIVGFDDADSVHKWIYDIFQDAIILEENEKVFTNKNLTYQTWNNHCAIRYLYQVTLEDGTVEEQDSEFEFLVTYNSEGQKIMRMVADRALSEKKVMKKD